MSVEVRCPIVSGDNEPIGDGIVKLIGYTENMEDMIVKAARVSYGGENNNTARSNIDLIRFLFRHNHTSPFEHSSFTFLISCPIFVARQWFRHRTGKYNEISARYTEVEDHFWSPDEFRGQSSSNRQCSDGIIDLPTEIHDEIKRTILTSYNTYNNLIGAGVAREQARAFLPQGTMTRFYFTMDLHNLLHFLELRLHPDAQPEIQEYARVISNIIKPLIPNVWAAFEDFKLNAITLTGPEIERIKELGLKLNIPWSSAPSRITGREKKEFIEKINKIF